jgi:hypothetical protein
MVREGDESRGGLRANRHDTVWGFAGEAIELPDTTYYRRMVADGDLLPADEQTAKTCRVPFRDVATVRFETQLANDAQDAVWLDETNGD